MRILANADVSGSVMQSGQRKIQQSLKLHIRASTSAAQARD
jgi:hypothetical protein